MSANLEKSTMATGVEKASFLFFFFLMTLAFIIIIFFSFVFFFYYSNFILFLNFT